jgi:hypothetical protein
MATKRATLPTRSIGEHELGAWLRGKIGEENLQDFAPKIGISRQMLSGIVHGDRQPGPSVIRKLKKYGMVRSERRYIVVDA